MEDLHCRSSLFAMMTVLPDLHQPGMQSGWIQPGARHEQIL